VRRLLLGLLVSVTAGALCFVSGTAAAENVSRLGSVGLQVVPIASGELVVLQIPPDTPAAASAMKPGDLIVSIDDFPLAGSDFAEVVSQRLWGPEGSQIVLHYLRPGEAGRKLATLRRVAADPKLTVSPAVRNGVQKKGGKQ
jgi:C-terminal processing protease CtpA/Prc